MHNTDAMHFKIDNEAAVRARWEGVAARFAAEQADDKVDDERWLRAVAHAFAGEQREAAFGAAVDAAIGLAADAGRFEDRFATAALARATAVALDMEFSACVIARAGARQQRAETLVDLLILSGRRLYCERLFFGGPL